MTIEKLKSGSYRIKQMYHGKYYSTTVKYKPTKKEAITLLAEVMNTNNLSNTKYKGTFNDICTEYISSNEGKFSPSTIRGYLSILRNLSDEFKNTRFSDLSNEIIQDELENYSNSRSPKSVKNAYGLISAVLKENNKQINLSIKLPRPKQKIEYEPTTKDINDILEGCAGSRYEVAIKLAVRGVRRGEICALTIDDLDGNVLTINKAIALDKNNKYIVKGTKTEESTRKIILPDSLVNLINRQGFIFKGNPHTINAYLHKLQDKLGIPRFKLHMMRHFSAAYLHKEGFTEEQIMAWHGWSDPDTMKNVYRYNLDPKESKIDMANAYDKLL